MTELKQTKSSFKLIGKVTRIDKDNAFREEESTKGAKEGELYRALRFGVKTSETNDVTVEMFDFEPTEVFLWSNDKKEKDDSYKGDRIPFGTWLDQQEELREEGLAVLQTRVGLNYGEDGKLVSKGLPSFVASEEIYNNIDNGDSVVVEGEIRYSKYTNKNDEVVEQKTFSIKRLFRLKDVDFNDEKFEEITYFEQEMVFVGIDVDKKEKKAFVTGRIIDYRGNFHDTQMTLDFSDGDDGLDEGMVKLTNTFVKSFKFGDVITVFGDAVNRVIIKEVEVKEGEVPKGDFASQLGGKSKPTHAQGYTARTYISEMQIHGVETWDKKVYKEADFVKDELIVDKKKESDSVSEFGGKSKSKGSNPFESDDDPFATNKGPIEISDDDLPF